MTKRLRATIRTWRAVRNSRHEDLAISNQTWLKLRRKIVAADRLLRSETHRDSRARAHVLRMGFRSSSTPLPINHPYIWGGEPAEILGEIRSFGAAAGLDEVIDLSEFLQALIDDETENPLWTAFLAIRQSFKESVVVGVRRHSALEHIEARCANLAATTSVLSIQELANLDERRTTVFFGPPSDYPDWVKVFPRSQTTWIRYAWNKPVHFPDALIGMLPVAATAATSKTVAPHALTEGGTAYEADDYGEPDELAAEMNRERLAKELERAGGSENSTTVDARIGVLGNDDYVILPIEEGTQVTVFDPDLRVVRREQARRLIPGMFVVVRERGGRDHLRSIAESKFLDAPTTVREAMSKWKAALNRSIQERGIDRVSSELTRLGVSVGHSTIRLWTTDLIHGPGNNNHFSALFDYLGLSDSAANWQYLLKVRRAGRQAGTYMRRQLIKQASRVRPDQLARDTTLRFTLDGVDGGALVAVRLDEVLPEVIKAPVEVVGQLIEGI